MGTREPFRARWYQREWFQDAWRIGLAIPTAFAILIFADRLIEGIAQVLLVSGYLAFAIFLGMALGIEFLLLRPDLPVLKRTGGR